MLIFGVFLSQMNQITDVVFDSMIHLTPKREGIVDFGTLQVQNAGTNMCSISGQFCLLQSFGDDVTVRLLVKHVNRIDNCLSLIRLQCLGFNETVSESYWYEWYPILHV